MEIWLLSRINRIIVFQGYCCTLLLAENRISKTQKGPKIYKFLSIIQIPDDFSCERLIASHVVNNCYLINLPFGKDGWYVC